MPYVITDKNNEHVGEQASINDAKRSLQQVTVWRPDETRAMGWNGWMADPEAYSPPDFKVTFHEGAIPVGMPGHGRGLTSARLQPVRLVDGYVQGGYTDKWEVICYDCGDDHNMNYDELPPQLQAIRGPYDTRDVAIVAVEEHIGIRRR
jgi:hypothetical protein